MTVVEQKHCRVFGVDISDRDIAARFVSGELPVAVYGLGKMGLPLCGVFADVTGAVIGVDVDHEVVQRVNRGEVSMPSEPGLDSLIQEQVNDGALEATTNATDAADRATVHLVIVPTLLSDDRRPDLSNIHDVAYSIGKGIDPGDIVFVESTVPPHTCREIVRPIIAYESGLDAGEFGVAYCPERTSSGRALKDIRGAYPKIVGGVDSESTRIAEVLYREVTANDIIPVADATTAECVKLFEGVYRDVNIALANELATFTDELDVNVRDAIRAANSQPYCNIHAPGPGVGGHCIPFYPWFLIDGRNQPADLIRSARSINERMPVFTAEKCLDLLRSRGLSPESSTAVLLGVAYRPGVPEVRMAPAISIAAELTNSGVSTFGVDPVLDELPEMAAMPLSFADIHTIDPDLVIVVTPHQEFESLDWSVFNDPIVIDCHGALSHDEIPHELYTVGGGPHV